MITEIRALREGAVAVVPAFVARHRDMMALAAKAPCKALAANGLIRDRPGFEVELLARGSEPEGLRATERHSVLMVMRGHWRLAWEGGEAAIAPGDTVAVPPGLAHAVQPSMEDEASLFRVTATDDPAGPTRRHV